MGWKSHSKKLDEVIHALAALLTENSPQHPPMGIPQEVKTPLLLAVQI
jgi:hypothetical protein